MTTSLVLSAHTLTHLFLGHQFNRILEIAGLTDAFLKAGTIDVDKLLRLKDSSECKDFRRWMWTPLTEKVTRKFDPN